MCVYVDVNEGVPLNSEVSDLPGARVTDSSEPRDVGAGNRTLVPCKSSVRVLNH